MRAVTPFTQLLAAAAALSMVLLPAAAQEPTEVCLTSGEHVRAERIETRGGKFYLYPEGGAAAVEVAPELVKSFGAPCGPTAPAPAAQRFGIHGSNTIGEHLMPMLIDAFSQKQFAQAAVIKPTGPAVMEIEILPRGVRHPTAVIDFQAKGSGTFAGALQERKAVIGMASRRATAQEADKVKATLTVDLLVPGNEHVLGLDGLVVIVHPDNPIKRLTLDQIARIFSGDISNWKEVSYRDPAGQQVRGRDRPIRLHARDDKAGIYDAFVALVLSPSKRQISPRATRYESSGNLSDAVAKDVDAIGFIGLPYVNKNHALGIASACGLISSPSKFTIKTEAYPLSERLYLYSIGTPTEPVARDLLEFVLSDEAQQIVAEARFVDQSIEFQDAEEQRQWAAALSRDKDTPATALSALGNVVQSARRSTVVFRFDYNSSALDAKVVQDVARLARYLSSPGITGKKFIIAGFADSNGGWSSNLRLSSERASRVATELQKLGVRVPQDSVMGFSYLAPVACNEEDDGRKKNRRVEVWIAR